MRNVSDQHALRLKQKIAMQLQSRFREKNSKRKLAVDKYKTTMIPLSDQIALVPFRVLTPSDRSIVASIMACEAKFDRDAFFNLFGFICDYNRLNANSVVELMEHQTKIWLLKNSAVRRANVMTQKWISVFRENSNLNEDVADQRENQFSSLGYAVVNRDGAYAGFLELDEDEEDLAEAKEHGCSDDEMPNNAVFFAYFVAAGFRRQGVATLVLTHMLNTLQQLPLRALVSDWNVASRRALVSLGFDRIGQTIPSSGLMSAASVFRAPTVSSKPAKSELNCAAVL